MCTSWDFIGLYFDDKSVPQRRVYLCMKNEIAN